MSDGCRLWTRLTGTGEPTVCCHGGPGLWDMFDEVASMVDDLVSVCRWDQRGCGRSEHRGPYALARSVADLDEVRAHLGAERVSVLGHSYGTSLALAYALAHPERVSRLIYVSGTGLGWGWRTQFKREMARREAANRARLDELEAVERTDEQEREYTMLRWAAEFNDPAAALEHARRMATPWLGINYACNQAINAEMRQTSHEQEMAAACRELTTPVLIIDGVHDPRPRWAVDALYQALPEVQRATLDTGRLPWLERPDEFRDLLREFLISAPHQPPPVSSM